MSQTKIEQDQEEGAADEAGKESARPRSKARSARSATSLIVLLDLVAAALAFLLALNIRADAPYMSPFTHSFERYYGMWPVLLLWPFVLWREGLYRGLWMPGGEHLKRLVQGTTVASMIVMTATFVLRAGPQYSRAVVIGGWLLSMPLLALERFGLKAALTQLGFAGPRTVLIGNGRAASMVLSSLARQRPSSLRPVAVFSDETGEEASSFHGVPVAGKVADAEPYAHEHGIRIAIVALPEPGQRDILNQLEGPDSPFQRTLIIPEQIGLSTAETTALDLGGLLALEVKKNLTYATNRVAKRGLDLILVGLLSPLVLLLGAVVSGAIALESGWPVFFGQARVGFKGRTFTAWKFRTMVHDAQEALEEHLARDPQARKEWESRQKLTEDPRLTIVGRFLRRFSLDELPQIWNVLRGEMSLVGPRPIMTDQVDMYGPALDLYTQVRPGLTGLWQVSGRASTTFQTRVELDQYYVRNWSVWLDMVILARTSWAVISGRGAY